MSASDFDPSTVDIWEIMMAVVTFFFIVKTNWAPKRFDVAKHLRTK